MNEQLLLNRGNIAGNVKALSNNGGTIRSIILQVGQVLYLMKVEM